MSDTAAAPVKPADLIQPPDVAAAYQATFDALKRAYWDATDPAHKDLVYGAIEAIGDIITAFDKQDLANNTALYLQLTPKMQAIGAALTKIQNQITDITKNLDTAAQVLTNATKLLALIPA